MTLPVDDQNYRRAAVLLPLVDAKPSAQKSYTIHTASGIFAFSDEAFLILTKRAENLLHHGGQISFPGGVPELHDENLFHTALRETEEEIGIAKEMVTFLLELPEVSTRSSKFKVTPYLGLLQELPVLKPNPEEIDKIIYVPLGHLLIPSTRSIEKYEDSGISRELPVYHFDGHRIWGATAVMIERLLKEIK